MSRAHPFSLLAAWLAVFVTNALLWPIWLIPLGPLGSMGPLAVMLGLAGAALLIARVGLTKANAAERKLTNLVTYVLAPLVIMAASGLFLTYPLIQLSHLLIYGSH